MGKMGTCKRRVTYDVQDDDIDYNVRDLNVSADGCMDEIQKRLFPSGVASCLRLTHARLQNFLPGNNIALVRASE